MSSQIWLLSQIPFTGGGGVSVKVYRPTYLHTYLHTYTIMSRQVAPLLRDGATKKIERSVKWHGLLLIPSEEFDKNISFLLLFLNHLKPHGSEEIIISLILACIGNFKYIYQTRWLRWEFNTTLFIDLWNLLMLMFCTVLVHSVGSADGQHTENDRGFRFDIWTNNMQWTVGCGVNHAQYVSSLINVKKN